LGCHGKKANPVVGDAEAAKKAQGKAAELAAARALMGDDDEDGRGNTGTSTGAGGTGTARWRDTVVYVDGTPAGVLRFGELPIALKPIWIDEKASAEIEPGSRAPGYKIHKARRYRFVDLLRAMGVDLKQVNELHVLGPKLSQVLIVSGAELRSRAGTGLMFRFGSLTGGKALPVIPATLGNRQHFDKISSVMVYLNKKPPKLVPNEGLELDGEMVEGVPYYGEPMRGGVRVYSDDKLVLQIKKRMLRELPPASRSDGLARYRLMALLDNRGIDTSKVVEGWLIADERRTRKLSREELAQLTVAMGDKHKNEFMLGTQKFDSESIALSSRPLSPADLPEIRPDEE
jgi:hypothetical protein